MKITRNTRRADGLTVGEAIDRDARLIAAAPALLAALESLLACIPPDSDPLPESAFDAGELLLEIQSHADNARAALAAAK